MSSSSSSVATIAAAVAGSAVLLYGASKIVRNSATARAAPADVEEIDDDDCISADDVCAAFDKLFLQMQQVVMQLSQQVQQVQMSGQVIPEKQLRQLLKSEFDRALLAAQVKVFEDFGVDADCLEEATWEFIDQPNEYPKVKRAVERFQKLYESISGETVAGWRPGKSGDATDETALAKPAPKELGPEELVKAAHVYFEALTFKMLEMAKVYEAAGKDLKNPMVAQTYHMEAATDANEAAEEALSKIGVAMNSFRTAIDKHSRIPAVGQTLGMLQMKQQQALQAAGIPM